MVKVCSYNYPKPEEEGYEEYYSLFSHPLHDFQKWSIKGIVTGNHILVAAPTGSGKSLPAEFAINYFHSKGKKVIYTSPIKALSNEKFYNFTKKYQHISFGLVTGDIKCNPDADCIIMTTEILLNKLYQIKSKNADKCPTSSVSFEMDIENELGCVIFDEIHFINDEHRGHVWEQSIMLLPHHVQMIGLSATLDNPEKFAHWLETKGDISKKPEKDVYLVRKQHRSVPLIHYSFITATNGVNKVIKDKATQEEIKRTINKPWIIQDEKNVFNDAQYQIINKTLKLFQKHDIRVKRQHVLNNVTEYLVEHEMLPALCYVFSRKQLERCAEELTTNVLEFDSKVPYTVDRECEQIIRKLPNYEEYLHLPEYVNLVKMLRKGVAIHHAGLMPILREMVELLFARGFIKILFCTETMSVGINLPVKTAIFTDINKFNGEINRTLYAHEYTQAGGRSGRLGLDKVGHVIHLNNLFRNVETATYKQMMNNKPQTLVSKFKISYNLILNLIDIGDNNLVQFAKKSMITGDLDSQMVQIYNQMSRLEAELDTSTQNIQYLRTPFEIVKQYNELLRTRENTVNKKRKEIERQIQDIQDKYKFLQQDRQIYDKIIVKEQELDTLKGQYKTIESYFQSGVGTVLELLRGENFIEDGLQSEPHTETIFDTTTNRDELNSVQLTLLGRIAAQIREIHCLAFARLFEDKTLDTLSAKQLVALFSCFTNIRVQDDMRDNVPKSDDQVVNSNVLNAARLYNEYKDKELSININTGFDYEIQYDLLNYVEKWCDSECVEDCKLVLQEMAEKKDIFLGEFVKALLKINNISCEFEKIAEMTGNIAFLSKLKEIPNMTLKYVVTNQSLYV